MVRVVDHLEDGGRSWLVMELVAGTDLSRVLEARGSPGLPLGEVLDFSRQAAEALEYVHEQHMVHRDVKPHNLIAGADGIVLVDFGVAREIGDDDGTRGIGTPRFMAPEVLVGEGVSPRSDVYGLAATVWTLLAGSPPAYGDPKPLSETAPEASPELERALRAGARPAPRPPLRLSRRTGHRARLAGRGRRRRVASRPASRAPTAPGCSRRWCARRPACSTPPRRRSP